MRLEHIYLFSLLAVPTTSSSDYAPFSSPQIGGFLREPAGLFAELQRRQDTCPSGYESCSSLGQAGSCCHTTAPCALDQAGHVACCPEGSSCTGTINVATVETGTSTSSITTATTSGLSVLATTTANTPQITDQSTLQNAYFPFVYIPTTYSNAAACSSYYSSCQTEFSSCTQSLGAGVNGVTVSGGGGGITVEGASATLSAASICSSLSSQACFGLQLANCQVFGTAGNTGTTSFVNAVPTKCAGLYGLGVGVGIGLAGQMLG